MNHRFVVSLSALLKRVVFLATAVLLTGLVSANGEDIVNSIGMKLVRIEPGSFLMGQDEPPADYKTVQHADKCDQADWDERPAPPR